MRINRSLIANVDQIINASDIAFTYGNISTNTTLTETDGIIIYFVNAVSSSITITLPTAISNNACFIIKKIDSSSNTVIIDGYSTETIDGSTSYTLYDQYNYVEIVSNDTNWLVTNEFRNEVWT